MVSDFRQWELGKEYPPPNEAALIEEIVASMLSQYEHEFPPGATTVARRDQHPKAHGCVRAEFTVRQDVPADLRYGIFKEPGSYAAWLRFSSSSEEMASDTSRDAHGMAIKLVGIPGLKVLEGEQNADTQDFILANNNTFFIRNTSDYVEFAKAFSAGKALGFFFGWNPQRWHLHELITMLRTKGKRITNPLQIQYWSQTAYRLGPRAVKLSARPVSQTKDPMPDKPGPDFLREALSETVQTKAVVFDLLVQLQTDPVRMPVEDATIVWDERASPFRKVATIRIPVQVCDTPERRIFAENLSYNPWHTLPDHQPLGATNRTRRSVYEAISKLRHERNGVPVEEPTLSAGNP